MAIMLTFAKNEEFSPVDYVNPLMGTHSEFALSAGNTYPAIARPWGMNFWSPQTGDMDVLLHGTQNKRIQADAPAEPVDQ